jgi:hypothetical protein
MHTIQEDKVHDSHFSALRSTNSPIPLPKDSDQKLKQREYISWTISFAVISLLTGLLKFLKLGVTMDSVTSGLFYLSVVGLVYFIYKIFSSPKKHAVQNLSSVHSLN